MTSYKKMITYLWNFSFGFFTIHNIWSFFICTSLLRSILEIFDISIWWTNLWLLGIIHFQYKSLSLFPNQILVCATVFAVHYLFLRFDIGWALKQKKKKKSGKRYRHKSTHVSKPTWLLTNHSWQAWRSIYNNHT